MLKKLRRTTSLLLGVGLTVGASMASAQPKDFKVGYALAPTSHYGAGANAWAAAVEQTTKGAFKFKQFPSSALGGERELVEGLLLGTVEGALVSTGALSNFVPEVGVTDIPFLFRNSAHARAVLDGPIGQELLNKFKSHGLVALAWGEQGFRHVTNGKLAITRPEDLKGLKIRTMENPVHITAFKTLGASPTPMSWPEVTGALQQGTIDGQENPISVIASAKLSSVQKYLSLTGHVYSPTLFLVSPKFWDSLDGGQKVAFMNGAAQGAVAMRKYVDDVEKTGVDELKAQGMQVTDIANKSAFQQALTPAYAQYASKYGKTLIERITNSR